MQAAWDATKWPRAAEIIYYGRPASTNGVGSGWTAAEFQAFQAMLTNAYLPLIENGSPNNGNWELTMIEGMMGIAVVTENQTLLQNAQAMWIQRIPATFYDFTDDGSIPSASGDPWPVPFPRSNGSGTTWNGQEIFTAATSGVTQETCRDLNHGGYSISAAIAAAETDYIQTNLTANLYTSTATYTPPAPWTGPGFQVDAENRLVEMLNVNAADTGPSPRRPQRTSAPALKARYPLGMARPTSSDTTNITTACTTRIWRTHRAPRASKAPQISITGSITMASRSRMIRMVAPT